MGEGGGGRGGEQNRLRISYSLLTYRRLYGCYYSNVVHTDMCDFTCVYAVGGGGGGCDSIRGHHERTDHVRGKERETEPETETKKMNT